MKIENLKKEFVKGIGNDRFSVKIEKYFYKQGKLLAKVSISNRYYFSSAILDVITVNRTKAICLSIILPSYSINYCRKYGVSTWEYVE